MVYKKPLAMHAAWSFITNSTGSPRNHAGRDPPNSHWPSAEQYAWPDAKFTSALYSGRRYPPVMFRL